jgi:hypothetical protein
MESVLLIVTIASLALTVAMVALVAKMLLDERRRSNARVAILSELASDAAANVTHRDPIDDFATENEFDSDEFNTAGDFNRERVSPAIASSDLFTVPDERSAWPKRIAVAAALVLAVVAVGFATRTATRLMGPSSSPAASTAAADTQPASQRLELLSLKHDQQTDALKITGLVQNPRNGAPLKQISATVFLFGGDGTFLASGRAPLDFTTLRPGDESGFVITVPVSSAVARYRVGFRGEDGRIIGHVDRRLTPTIARGSS